MKGKRIPKSQLLKSLPDEWSQNLRPVIDARNRADRRKIVVLDDDPTGTQTIHDLPVLTEWSTEALATEFKNDLPAFYILTNSRSFTLPVARKINADIGRNLIVASEQTGRTFSVVSRSDSTLRGHFPGEVEALSDALGRGYDGCIIIPFFQEGGRYTVNNVHYVEEDGVLVPAAETEFAGDHVFGYSVSNLCDWVAEKTGGQIVAKDVVSISIEDLRRGGPESVTTILMALHRGSYCVVNALGYRDLEVFVQGLLAAEGCGKRFIFRTAASFVQVRAGLTPRPLLTKIDLPLPPAGGGLIVVGSFVPRSTRQVEALLAERDLSHIEIDVDALVDDQLRDGEINRAVDDMETMLRRGIDVLIFTSRRLKIGKDSTESLQIGQTISKGLITVVRRLRQRPRYIVAKGGITSSDIATRALDVKKAFVLGQIQPGVPVWRLGHESCFPDLIYIVFPGNVGDEKALVDIVRQLRVRDDCKWRS